MTQNNKQFTSGFRLAMFGCDFFADVKPNPDRLVSDLTSGKSVRVIGLDRIGKTSLLMETRRRLQVQGRHVIWVDMNAYNTPTRALAKILQSMRKGSKLGTFARFRYWVDNSHRVPASLKSLAGALLSGYVSRHSTENGANHLAELSSQTIRLLKDQNQATKPIIIFDELATKIRQTINVYKNKDTRFVVGEWNNLLGLLRVLRTPDYGVTMAISGTVSFDLLQEEYGIRSETVNDCLDRRVQELDRDGARRLLEMCVEAENLPKWSELLMEELLDLLPAYYPGVVQLPFILMRGDSTPAATLDDSMRDNIKIALSEHYYWQLGNLFRQFSNSEKDRINSLFDILFMKENGKMAVREALDILKGGELDNIEPNGREIIDRLESRSFIDILGDEIRFSSGLVSRWHSFAMKECI